MEVRDRHVGVCSGFFKPLMQSPRCVALVMDLWAQSFSIRLLYASFFRPFCQFIIYTGWAQISHPHDSAMHISTRVREVGLTFTSRCSFISKVQLQVHSIPMLSQNRSFPSPWLILATFDLDSGVQLLQVYIEVVSME